jgi:hypothetical protein
MPKCDLCDAPTDLGDLETLLDQYQVPGVRDVCPKCRRWANALRGEMLAEIGPRIRAAMMTRKMTPEKPAPAAQPWWRRAGRAIGHAFSTT